MDLEKDTSKNRVTAYKLLGIQLAVSVVISFLLLVFSGSVPAYSALLGGLAYILPNAYFARFAFRGTGQESPLVILRWFYLGEAGKLVIAGVIFALCFALIKPLHVIVLFSSYIIMIFVNLAGLTINKYGPIKTF